MTPTIKNDITGQRFSRLTVVGVAKESDGWNARLWLCRCDCGKESRVSSYRLRKGLSKSCGCLNSELTRERSSRYGARVGGKRTVEYETWCRINRRCHKPNCKDFKWYGGRGITVHPAWRKSFRDFLAYIGPRPGPKYSIDRIDNDGNYEPGNVRWATKGQQARNTRGNALYTYGGRSLTIAGWVEVTGIDRGTLQCRLGRLGWPVERALTEPVRKCFARYGRNAADRRTRAEEGR